MAAVSNRDKEIERMHELLKRPLEEVEGYGFFKNLRRGDKVRFQNGEKWLKKDISGEGRVYGFGKLEQEEVWITMDDGELILTRYKDVEKI